MKKITLRLLVIIMMGVVVLQACKKGEEDPFLSLRTRDARITGEWKLTDLNYTKTTTTVYSGISNTVTITATYDGTTLTMSDGTSTSTSAYAASLTLDKDSRYEIIATLDGTVNTDKGFWSWIDGKKDKLYVNIADTDYYIKKLKNKEMILTEESESSQVDSGNSQTVVEKTEYTYEKQ